MGRTVTHTKLSVNWSVLGLMDRPLDWLIRVPMAFSWVDWWISWLNFSPVNQSVNGTRNSSYYLQVSGQCTCRKNVEGRQCNRCKSRTFTLDHHNPAGCTGCFCSGKSDRCFQAPYIWKAISHAGNRVDFTYTTASSAAHGRQHHHHQTEHLNRSLAMDTLSFGVSHATLPKKQYDTPFYWNLPSQFLGDKILSYNGRLTFQLDGEFQSDAHHQRVRGFGAFPLALLQVIFFLRLEWNNFNFFY